MVYTAKSIRDALWPWGEAVKHGYHKGHAPADPETPRLAVHFGPRLPCDTDYLDISRAFAALNPATRGLANAGNLAWYAHAPDVSRRQQVVWLYYVEGIGLLSFRREWRRMSPETRTVLLELDQQHTGRYIVPEDDRGDDIIGTRLGVSGRTVRRDRGSAIEDMLAFLQPSRPAESAA